MSKCKFLLSLVLSFLLLFGSFSVSAYASDLDENLIDSDIRNWSQLSSIDSSALKLGVGYSSLGYYYINSTYSSETGDYGALYSLSNLNVGYNYKISFDYGFNDYSLNNLKNGTYGVIVGLGYFDDNNDLISDDGYYYEISHSNSQTLQDGLFYNVNFDFTYEQSLSQHYLFIYFVQTSEFIDTNVVQVRFNNFSLSRVTSETDKKLDGVLGFLDTIKNSLVDMQTDIRNFFNNIGSYFSNLGDRISGFFDTLLTNDDENTANIGQGLVDIWQRIIDKLTLVATGITSDITNSWQQTVSKLESVKNQISNEISSSWQNIVSKLNDLKVNIVNSLSDLGNNIINGIKDLFIPSDGYFENYSQMYYDLASDRFGALFTVFDISDNFIKSFDADKTTEYIDIPLYNFDLMGYHFSFGGWKMYIIPQYDVFTDIVSTLKGFFNVIATFGFIGSLKSRYDEIFGG